MTFHSSLATNRIVFALCLVLAVFANSERAVAGLKWGTIERSGIKLTLVMDDASEKVYLNASGPPDKWFAWGFGQTTMEGYALIFNTGSGGNCFETTMQPFVQPTPQTQQNTPVGFISESFGDITFGMERPLQTSDTNDYVFSTAASTIDVTWALGNRPFEMHNDRGVDLLSLSNAPAPRLTSVQRHAGTTTLTINDLALSLTNKIEFISELGASNWITVSNLIFSPPRGGASLSLFLTNLTVSITANDTNAAGFYRVRQ